MFEVTCQECGAVHTAEFSHIGGYDTKVDVYAVMCTVDNLTDYYTSEVVREVQR